MPGATSFLRSIKIDQNFRDEPLLRVNRLSPMPRSRLETDIQFEFEKGTIKLSDPRPADLVYLTFKPNPPDLPDYKLGNWSPEWEHTVRKFIAIVKGNDCYLDCGSIGRCERCTKTGLSFDDKNGIRDYYHQSSDYREATDQELRDICMDIWIDRVSWQEAGYYLSNAGLKAADERFVQTRERFISQRNVPSIDSRFTLTPF